MASSIHELGVILGEEIAAEDLVPIFDGFIKDLDEVRDSLCVYKVWSNLLLFLGPNWCSEAFSKFSLSSLRGHEECLPSKTGGETCSFPPFTKLTICPGVPQDGQ